MAEFYTDMYDCPVDKYHLCLENSDFKFLVKSGEYSASDLPKLKELFDKIEDQKIQEFGVSKEFEIYYFKSLDVLKMELKVLEGDRSAITFLNTYKSDLERIKKTLKGDDGDNIRKYHARLHRSIQTRYPGRNSHQLTVFEFYNDIHDMLDEQKEKEVYTREIRKHG